jgi:hypothetical protein
VVVANIKVPHICSVCGVEFKSSSKTPRHKCKGELKGKTGTGIRIEDIEIPEMIDHDVVIDVPESNLPDDDIPEDQWEPATMEMPVVQAEAIPLGEQEFARGAQAPKTTKKDRDKLQDLLKVYIAAVDGEKYSMEDKLQIISNLWADALDVRIETVQTIISPKMYGVVATLGAVMLLGKEKLPLAELRRMVSASPKVEDPFDES